MTDGGLASLISQAIGSCHVLGHVSFVRVGGFLPGMAIGEFWRDREGLDEMFGEMPNQLPVFLVPVHSMVIIVSNAWLIQELIRITSTKNSQGLVRL